MHNLASPSPVTDGERVIAWFGTGQVLCLSLDDKLIWQRNLAADYARYELLWGHGSSPVLYGEKLFLLSDHHPAAYLLALDKRTGRNVWKVDRGEKLRSYSTPLVIDTGGRQELIINSNPRLDAYNPESGRPLWHAGEFVKVPVPMPVLGHGILYASRGYSSGPYMAVRPGGTGDVSASRVLWRMPPGAPLRLFPALLPGATLHGLGEGNRAGGGAGHRQDGVDLPHRREVLGFSGGCRREDLPAERGRQHRDPLTRPHGIDPGP